jgi:CBS domain-containing protein
MTAPLIIESTVRFLRAHEPFARMARSELEFLVVRAELTYHPVGSIVIGPGTTSGALFVVHQGHVSTIDASGAAVVLGPGECFPLAIDPSGPPPIAYAATEDAFCLRLEAADAAALRAASGPFAEFCTQSRAALLRRSAAPARGEFGSRVIEQQALLRPVGTLVRRAPVACLATTSLRAALRAMSDAEVGTIAIRDDQDHPVGIFTLTDLMERVVLPGVSLEDAVGGSMTATPGTIDAAATAEEALALMAESHYHQLLVTRDGCLVGVVSERDLFALQRVSMRHVLASVRRAGDLGALRRVAAESGQLATNLLAQGLSAQALTRTVAALRDAITARVLALVAPGHALDGVDWCWLSLGSEGRGEQTIISDQDNALIYDPGHYPRVEARHRLLAFAAEVNAALAGVGFPECPGGVMAGRPDYCLTAVEWRERFAGWLREPTPEALLGATTMVDFRAIAGSTALATALREWLAGGAAASPLFLRLLTAQALAVAPPLGLVRTFVTADGPGGNLIDLKTRGARLFVDAARVLALGAGVIETGTASRLRLAGRALGLEERDAAAFVDAFQFLQGLRLRVQRGSPDAATVPNAIDPAELNDLDRRMLQEALRQARRLQALCATVHSP